MSAVGGAEAANGAEARRQGYASLVVRRHLNIGYNRAAKLVEQMEKEGVVGAANHVGKREVLAPGPRE